MDAENVEPVDEGPEDWEEIVEVLATHVPVNHLPATEEPSTHGPVTQVPATQMPVDLVPVVAQPVVDEADVPVNKPEEQDLQLPATNPLNPVQGLPLFLYPNHGDLLAFAPNHPHPHHPLCPPNVGQKSLVRSQ